MDLDIEGNVELIPGFKITRTATYTYFQEYYPSYYGEGDISIEAARELEIKSIGEDAIIPLLEALEGFEPNAGNGLTLTSTVEIMNEEDFKL